MSRYLSAQQLTDLMPSAPGEAKATPERKRMEMDPSARETVRDCAGFLRGMCARLGDPHMDRRMAFDDLRAWANKLEAL